MDAAGVDAVAGVDAIAGADASSRDAGTSALDGSPSVDGAGGGDAAAQGGGPPTITAITPNSGVNNQPVDVTVIGTGFVVGLMLKIGAISADVVSVPGPTTIHAKVPMGIAPGAYDVLVTNPDGEAAVLPNGYTVLAATGHAPKSGTCGCSSAGGSDPRGMILLACCLLALRSTFRIRTRGRERRADRDRWS
jgi:hypothetical protein